MSDDRSQYLGGTDVAGILNVSPWASPTSIWMEKLGRSTPHLPDQERLEIGKDAEVFLAAVFHRHHPHLFLGGAQAELRHPEYPWLRGHADGFVLESEAADIGNAIAGWEAKTDNSYAPWDVVPV